jgi:predicted nucleotidyltransferase component of viral defense system
MINDFLKLNPEDRQEIFNEIFRQKNIIPIAIEKDWWVVQTLRLIFEMEMAESLVFKGGTSLSKGWGIIERFSEDIDLALDRRYLGFTGDLSKNQVDKLRKASHKFIKEQFFPALRGKFEEAGFVDISIDLPESIQSDKDPQTIEISYHSILPQVSEYIRPKVLIEIGSRSLHEPFSQRPINSFVGAYFEGRPFADRPTDIPCVNVERTFLEKLFLLHEEFQKPHPSIRTHRLSRHLYDLEKIMDSEYGKKALESPALYQEIVKHRSKLTRINGLDYSKHAPKYINPIPPDITLKSWEADYKTMQSQMIYGDSLPFDELLSKLKALKEKINQLNLEIKL